jgi:hypothetical protein
MAVPPSIKPMYVWWVCRVQWCVWQAECCGMVAVMFLLLLLLVVVLSVFCDVTQGEVCLVTEGVGWGLG